MMVTAFLVMNIASAAHADCAEGMLCGDMQQTTSVTDHSNHDGDQPEPSCDNCIAGHHHHYKTSLSADKAADLATSRQERHGWNVEHYFFQLPSPPSKPPKA